MEVPSVNMAGVLQGANSGQVVAKNNASVEVPVQKPSLEAQVSKTKDPGYQAVKQAAEALKSTFVVSDVRFTIFKDIAGDYVTRFTSLRDGSVKYYPQKSLFETVKIMNAKYEAMIDGQA
jgi:hypothetical protein